MFQEVPFSAANIESKVDQVTSDAAPITQEQLGQLIRRCQESLNREQGLSWNILATLCFCRLRENITSIADVKIEANSTSKRELTEYIALLGQLNILKYFKQENTALFPTPTRIEQLLEAAQNETEPGDWSDNHFLVPPEAIVAQEGERQSKPKEIASTASINKRSQSANGKLSKPAQTKRDPDQVSEMESRLLNSSDYAYEPLWLSTWLNKSPSYDRSWIPDAAIKDCLSKRANVAKAFIKFSVRRVSLSNLRASPLSDSWQLAAESRFLEALTEQPEKLIRVFLRQIDHLYTRMVARFVLCADLYPFLRSVGRTNCDTRSFLCIPYTSAPLTAAILAWARSKYESLLDCQPAQQTAKEREVYQQCFVIGQYLNNLWNPYRTEAKKSDKELLFMNSHENEQYLTMNSLLSKNFEKNVRKFSNRHAGLRGISPEEISKILKEFHYLMSSTNPTVGASAK